MKDTGRLARLAAPWLILAVVLAFYGRALGRGFTSEDFLLVRYLGENPPWRDLAALFSSPWLGISVVKFWRPVSTLLYGIEIAVFGSHPIGYNVVHVLVHTGNAVLVWAIARRLGRALPPQPDAPDEVAPCAAALLFAVYPLHPNAVIWSASFATLFASTFLLAAMIVYLRFRETGARSSQILALGLFALGLGSYEAAVVFPVVLTAADFLLIRRDRRRQVLDSLPFFLLTGLYLLLRKSLFGVFVGGYEEQGRSLLHPQLGPLLHDLAASIVWLHVPDYGRVPGPLALSLGCLLLVGAPLAFLWRRSHLRLWLFGWVWTLAALAPFAFRPSVPANGRYWYLAAAGVSLSLTFLLRARRSPLAFLMLTAAGLFWGVLLRGYLGVYREAGETARAVQRELVQSAPAPGVMRFLTGPPDFLRNGIGTPVAQVLRYGVWDAVHPPFAKATAAVYPLPPLQGAELLPIVRGAPGSRIDVWDAQRREIRLAVLPAAGSEPVELAVIGPAEGAAVDTSHEVIRVAVPSGLHERFRLIVVTRGNPAVIDLAPEAVQGGILQAPFPEDFCRSMDQLYGGEMFWWIEARDAAGSMSGFTPLRSFRVGR